MQIGKIENTFFELIQVSLGTRICFSHTPSTDEWGKMYDMAKKQSLVGVCFAGVQRLVEQKQELPEMLYLTWMGMAAKIQQRNEVVNRQCVELQAKLSADGFKSCILKGQGVTSYYSRDLSLLRQSGDIDVWIDSDRKSIIDYAMKVNHRAVDVSTKHVELHLFYDTEIEAHFVPAQIWAPVLSKRVQEFYDIQKTIQMENVVELHNGYKLNAPTRVFNAIQLTNHSFIHFFFEGVGLRQMMDYYFVMQYKFSEKEKNIIIDNLKRTHLYKFACCVSYVIETAFGASPSFIPADRINGKALLDSIMKEGNFGKYDEKRDTSKMDSSWYRFWFHNKRLLRFFFISPCVVAYSPIHRIREFVWRVANGYFKK